MKISSAQRSVGARFALMAFLSGLCLGAPSPLHAQTCCAAGGAAANSLAGRGSTTKSVTARYWFDIVPRVDREESRPPAENKPAENKAASQPAKDIAVRLMDWIAAKTGWTVREVPPIHFVPHAELAKKFGQQPTKFHVEALYAEQDHSVYLANQWRADDLRDRSLLLHELVHHLQYLNHVKATCESEYEFRAFRLQAQWLSEQGIEYPLDFIGIDPYFLLVLRHCDEM